MTLKRHGAGRISQPSTQAGRDLLDRLEARCKLLGGCKVAGADHIDVERRLAQIEQEAAQKAKPFFSDERLELWVP